MTTVRFKHPTDGNYDAGSIHEFDDPIATLYLQRGVAEMPMSAAIRLATELNDATTIRDVARAEDIRVELAALANGLTQEQKVQLSRVTSAIHGDSFEAKRTDKMIRSTDKNVKHKAAV